MKRALAFRAIVPFLVLSLILPGCATFPSGPTPEVRATLGTIGVSRALYSPNTEFAVPAKGRAEGAVKGAAAAFAGVIEGGLQGGHGVSDDAAGYYILLLFALATVATPVGAVVGAVKAMPGKEAASSEALTKEILERMRTQEVLRGEVLDVAIGKTGRRILPVDGIGPMAADNIATYESLSGKGIDTVLEVALQRIALESDTWGSDPPLTFTMSARCRLVHVLDGKVIDDHEYRTGSEPRKFGVWIDDNGDLLGREYEEGYRRLAQAIVHRLFLALPKQK